MLQVFARNARRVWVGIAASLLFAMGPLSAQASVFSTDWRSTGDNLITRDTVTGLDWLDFSQSIGPLFSTNALLGPGGALEGWKLASIPQMQTLVSNFATSTGKAEHQLMELMGSTGCYYAGPCLPYAAFYTQESLNSISWQGPGGSLPLVLVGASQLITPSIVVPHETYWASACRGCPADLANANYNHALALYRETPPVPEPAAWMLMIIGFGLSGAAFRRARAFVL